MEESWRSVKDAEYTKSFQFWAFANEKQSR